MASSAHTVLLRNLGPLHLNTQSAQRLDIHCRDYYLLHSDDSHQRKKKASVQFHQATLKFCDFEQLSAC